MNLQYLAKPRYEDLVMVSNSSIAQFICLGFVIANDGLDPTTPPFMSILNKRFKQASDIEEQQITIHDTTAMPYVLTVPETLYKYRLALILPVLLIGVMLTAMIVYARSRNFKAQHNQMNGLYNRSFAKRMTSKDITLRQHRAGAMLLLDLDHFKSVNDTLGHQTGDARLVDTASILRTTFRSSDIVNCLGGDEFLIYLPCNDPGVFLPAKLEQLRTALDKDVVSCSIGVVVVPRNGIMYDVLYQHADEALVCRQEAET